MTPDQLRKPSNKKQSGGSAGGGGGGQGAIRGKRVLPTGSASAATAVTIPISANSNSNSSPNPDLIINNVNDKKPDLGSLQAGVFSQALYFGLIFRFPF